MTDEKVEELADGVYYAPIFFSPKTGNRGFVAAKEMLSSYKSHARKAAREYRQRLLSQWGLHYSGELIKIRVPEDKEKYPLFKINEGGTILPFACTAGPLYESEMAARKTQEKK